MTDLPKTLKEAITNRDSERIASNLTNLASAYVLLTEDNDRLIAQLEENKKYQAEIMAMGERDPKTLTLEEVKELYGRAVAPRRTNR